MNARYYATAGVLGVGWLGVLMIPGWTRSWLLGAAGSWRWQALLLGITGLVVAAGFRRPIAAARSRADHLRMAVLVPYAGCVVYLTLFNAWIWARSWWLGGLANLHDSLSLYLLGIGAAATAFFVVIPYGLLCQWLMNRAANAEAEAVGAGRPPAGPPTP